MTDRYRYAGASGARIISELLSKSRHGPDVSAAEGLFRRLYVLQRLPYGACDAVLKTIAPSIIVTALAVMTDAVLKNGLVLAGRWLHRWLSMSQLRCVAALIDRRPRRAFQTLLWP